LVGGGLIRSLGGWEEVKRLGPKGRDRHRGDQRILGETDFVLEVLSRANEKYSRSYEMKSLGYNLNKVEERVIEIFDIDREALYSRSREKVRVEARSVFCYWAVRELGLKGIEMAKRLGVSQPAVVYAVKRGEKIARDLKLRLIA
jgi:hypothetical protein